jgi:hypothetical protein
MELLLIILLARNPWRCQVQFQNGFQLDITPNNCADFELTKDSGSPTVLAH